MKTIKKVSWIAAILFIAGIKYSTAQTTLEITSQKTDKGDTIKSVSKEMILPVEGKTAAELYQKSLNWLQVTYTNPDKVQKGQVENEYLRFQGVTSNIICVSALGLMTCYDLRYTIELKFKDGRFKFEIIEAEQYFPRTQYSSGGWYPASFSWLVTKKKGTKEEPNGLRNVEQLQLYFSNLANNLKSTILSESLAVTSADEDW